MILSDRPDSSKGALTRYTAIARPEFGTRVNHDTDNSFGPPQRRGNHRRRAFDHLPLSIIEGGDGQKQIHPADWHIENDKSIEQVREYHRSLMNEAMNAKVEFNSVGGHVHEVVITRAEWKWTLPPLPKAAQGSFTKPTTTPEPTTRVR
jgi:hypothetical protein